MIRPWRYSNAPSPFNFFTVATSTPSPTHHDNRLGTLFPRFADWASYEQDRAVHVLDRRSCQAPLCAVAAMALSSPANAVDVSAALTQLEALEADQYFVAFGPAGIQFCGTPNGYSAYVLGYAVKSEGKSNLSVATSFRQKSSRTSEAARSRRWCGPLLAVSRTRSSSPTR